MAIQAARRSLAYNSVSARDLDFVWMGSESKPYAVKPSITTIAAALGAGPELGGADLEFACKAGTEAMRLGLAHAQARPETLALAIGSDTAQSGPADALEFATAAGAAAFLIGAGPDVICELEDALSLTDDTPDFFRRARERYPAHGHRFTAEPGYFKHVRDASLRLMSRLGARPPDFTYVVFHYPNDLFPRRVAADLGFSQTQVAPCLAVGDRIGNTYAASTLLGLAATLDVAQAGDRILCVSYGSGAGADALAFKIRPKIADVRPNRPSVLEDLAASHIVRGYADYTSAIRHL